MNNLNAGLGLILGLAAIVPANRAAPVSITTGNQAYSQNFDSLTQLASVQTWTNGTTLTGWDLFNAGGAAIAVYTGGTGSSNAGSIYSFGSGSSSDRALDGVGSGGAYFGLPAAGAIAGHIAVELTNTSGATLDGFTVGFNGEQWRNGGNASAQTMVFEYGFGNRFAAVGNWAAPGGLFDWTTVANPATAAAVDGNVAGLVAGRGGVINTAWHNNATLWLRWTERNDLGNDHGLAIDNFFFTSGAASAPVPVPLAFGLMAMGLAALRRYRRKQACGRRTAPEAC